MKLFENFYFYFPTCLNSRNFSYLIPILCTHEIKIRKVYAITHEWAQHGDAHNTAVRLLLSCRIDIAVFYTHFVCGGTISTLWYYVLFGIISTFWYNVLFSTTCFLVLYVLFGTAVHFGAVVNVGTCSLYTVCYLLYSLDTYTYILL